MPPFGPGKMPPTAQGTPVKGGPGYGPGNMPTQARGTPAAGFKKVGVVKKSKKKSK